MFLTHNLTFYLQNQLRRVLLRSNLLGKSKTLEGFAYATPERNRVFGGPGHNATVNYLYDQIAALGNYYDVEFPTLCSAVHSRKCYGCCEW